jgi:hypothetical protein
MANPEHLAKLKEGVEAWNLWRRKHFRGIPDLSEVDLHGIFLRKANLSEANLRMMNLREADLREVDLSGSDLSLADLSLACLWMADFTGTRIGYTTFVNIDLSGVKGLITAKHLSPSSIAVLCRDGLRTLKRVVLNIAVVLTGFLTPYIPPLPSRMPMP